MDSKIVRCETCNRPMFKWQAIKWERLIKPSIRYYCSVACETKGEIECLKQMK